ncbi:MAG: NADH-quinone oxidoreductase subunit N, partial [Chloroflexi bacterium]|nr:NADH-quinone oxidoreductase subunit N [Chloroflexota bacterium]
DLWAQLPSVLPEIGLTALAIGVLFADIYGSLATRRNVVYISAIGMALLALLPLIWSPDPALYENGALLWGGMVNYDPLSQIFKVMLLLAGAVTCLMAAGDKGVGDKGEFYLIVIVATLGGLMMSSASDLILVFVALETLSIPLYMLASFRRGDQRSSESGMKYFLYGAFASAIMLFGFSLLYGFAGTTNLAGIADAMNGGFDDGVVAVMTALVMVVVGFGFKISAVPFHFWTPDVYEGAPTPVTAFVSVSSKAASFALLLRFLTAVFPDQLAIAGVVMQDFWVNLLVVVSIVTMTLGNVVALRQSNIKRLLAYSSIAQAGYTLIGVAALQGANDGLAVASVSFYMFMYIFTNLLVFGGVILFIAKTDSEEISDMAGLNRRSPWLALFITIGLLSLGGIPPAAGFFGKFFLFQAAVNSNLVGLALIAVTNAIIALYYYLVLIKVMYVDIGPDDDSPIAIPRTYGWSLGITALVVILLGTIAVTPIYDWAVQGAAGL